MLEPALSNGWSVKDMLAHLGAWETRAEYLYRSLSSGKDPEDTITDFNVFNANTYDANRDKPLAEIQQTEQAAFLKLRTVAQTAPEADLLIRRASPGRAGVNLPVSLPPTPSTIMPSTCLTCRIG